MKTKFKKGDSVFSYSLQEFGEVTGIDNSHDRPLHVKFDKSGFCYFTENGRRSPKDKAIDLFYDKVSIIAPPRPLQDKDIVKYSGDEKQKFVICFGFYDKKYNKLFDSYGRRNGNTWDNIVYVPDEEAPQELVAMRDELED